MEKPAFLRNEVFKSGNCLFFDDLNTMMISLTSFIFAAELFLHKSSRIIDAGDDNRLDKILEIPFKGATIKETYAFKAFKPMKLTVENKKLDEIEFKVYEHLKVNLKDIPGSTYIEQPLNFNQRIIGSAFVNFFETSRVKIEGKFTSNTNTWPSELIFARVIRNAFSHGGQIHFNNMGASSASWKSLTIPRRTMENSFTMKSSW